MSQSIFRNPPEKQCGAIEQKKPNLSIGLINWIRENEFREGSEETTGLKMCPAQEPDTVFEAVTNSELTLLGGSRFGSVNSSCCNGVEVGLSHVAGLLHSFLHGFKRIVGSGHSAFHYSNSGL